MSSTPPPSGQIPVMYFWRGSDKLPMVAAAFAEPLGFACDAWCYEDEKLRFNRPARRLADGGVELRHRWLDSEGLLMITTVTPAPDSVQMVARMVEESSDAPAAGLVAYPRPNICWQLRRAPMFSSWPDAYPEFIKRCFIFTDRGLTFLHQTQRLPIPVRSPDDECNNPPWVQTYLPVWRPMEVAPPDGWAAFSPDRYVYPIIGIVSRDGQYLAAIVTDGNQQVCQAWHDCMHSFGDWVSVPERPDKVWRMHIYLMRNDPDALLRRVEADFPQAMRLHERRVPA